MEGDTRLALIEQRIDDFSDILSKLDNTIDKLSDVNSNIIKMLAIHEEKVTQSEKTDSIFYGKFREIDKKIDTINRIQWITIGVGTLLAIIFSGYGQNIMKIHYPQYVPEHQTSPPRT